MKCCLLLCVSASSAFVRLGPRMVHRPPAGTARATPLRMMAGPVPVDDSWTTMASGLKFRDEKLGDGEQPDKGAVVRVAYTGWLEESGREFDSSIGRDPIAFAVGTGRVIPGWDEGIASMRVGSKRRLSIPPSLGYGAEGSGGIPGGATLQFDCELVSIETGVGAFLSSVPGGTPNVIIVSLLLLSFIPYLLPETNQPDAWKSSADVVAPAPADSTANDDLASIAGDAGTAGVFP